ncbi:hypothetical protein Sarmat_00873 [Rickettsiales endosymbiont of Paramecium tredecaurelia]|uniref:hypothetical protein n=1 Tax=Candidatus Sarmatiella mevalonica TaxID=2770581 RepID=UPI00192184F6|nr:hypothetical protein [Candidatus Sarmatiella mevalonica]MBL3285009.1 hypothetical protein [Candidatus Sarmatiella mevalonica]
MLFITMRNVRAIILVFIALSFLTGCQAKEMSPNVYAQDQVGVVSSAYPGRIVVVRSVRVRPSDEGRETAETAAIGAVGGGAIGYALGGKGNRGYTALAGSLAGAVAGAIIGDKGGKKSAYEYTIELDSGKKVTLVQGTQSPLAQGQRVLLITSTNGRSRVVQE